ncbi:MAG: translation initiation factor IF-2 [Candidatus Polarisedimenticolaceae bacterium]|nr:translation initiation factor IF-2 [Candidatus Polarisedimenticolaceae bacterium]
MSNVTVKELAEMVGTPVDRLLSQIADAGIKVNDSNSVISDDEKSQLLSYLRKSHGKTESVDTAAPKKITLRRKSVTELRQPTASSRATGRAPSGHGKTVSVEVRRKRTYVKRDAVTEDDSDAIKAEAEKAQKALDEQAAQKREVEAESEARKAAEAARRKAETAEEDELKRKADELRLQQEEETRKQEKEQALEVAKQQVVQQKEEHAAKKSPRKETDNKQPTKSRAAKSGGRKELHVAAGTRGRRKKKVTKRRSGSVSQASDAEHAFVRPTAPVVKEVSVPEDITVGDLAQRMSVKAADVIRELMKMGSMATINQSLDQDTAMLLVEEMGHKAIVAKDETVEDEVLNFDEEVGKKVARPPVVTIMGHVDHGKTSLLDHIRKTRVAAGEAGGITQHIGAYHVETNNGTISFLDTPGHAAFTAMRARGAKVTDIVILVVAADDGVKPQTIEAIQHARAAEVPLIIAINKIDKEEAQPDRVIQELTQYEVVPEDWGGDTMFVNVSAKTGEGIDQLLDTISLQAEVLELVAVEDGMARGSIVESSLDKGRGPVATVLVRSGTLKRGDVIVSGKEFGRVRALFDESGKQVKSAGPSIPVVVLGLSGVPDAGDDMMVVSDEKQAREVATLRVDRHRDSRFAEQKATKLDEFFSNMTAGDVQTLNIIIKADVQGSVEALRESLTKNSTDEVKVRIVASGVGGITESDAHLAVTSEAIVIGFNVRADSGARRILEDKGIDLRYYSIIYEVIDDVRSAMSGMLSPEIREEIVGLAEVRDVFRSSKLGAVAGCMVLEGSVKRNNPIRVLRDNVVVFEGVLESLRRHRDDVAEVKVGTECGIAVKSYNDVKPGDQIEVFERTEVAREI